MNLGSLKNAAMDAVGEVRSKVAKQSDTERRMSEALSNKNWGASSTLMNEIAQDTFQFDRYGTVMTTIWKALDSSGRNWRIVFKTLTLLEHLLKHGSEKVVEDARDHLHKIRTLTDFNYFEGSTDRGNGVREKSKAIMELLSSNEIIREERAKAAKLRAKFQGIGRMGASTMPSFGNNSTFGGFSETSSGYRDSGSRMDDARERTKDPYQRGTTSHDYDDRERSQERVKDKKSKKKETRKEESEESSQSEDDRKSKKKSASKPKKSSKSKPKPGNTQALAPVQGNPVPLPPASHATSVNIFDTPAQAAPAQHTGFDAFSPTSPSLTANAAFAPAQPISGFEHAAAYTFPQQPRPASFDNPFAISTQQPADPFGASSAQQAGPAFAPNPPQQTANFFTGSTAQPSGSNFLQHTQQQPADPFGTSSAQHAPIFAPNPSQQSANFFAGNTAQPSTSNIPQHTQHQPVDLFGASATQQTAVNFAPNPPQNPVSFFDGSTAQPSNSNFPQHTQQSTDIFGGGIISSPRVPEHNSQQQPSIQEMQAALQQQAELLKKQQEQLELQRRLFETQMNASAAGISSPRGDSFQQPTNNPFGLQSESHQNSQFGVQTQGKQPQKAKAVPLEGKLVDLSMLFTNKELEGAKSQPSAQVDGIVEIGFDFGGKRRTSSSEGSAKVNPLCGVAVPSNRTAPAMMGFAPVVQPGMGMAPNMGMGMGMAPNMGMASSMGMNMGMGMAPNMGMGVMPGNMQSMQQMQQLQLQMQQLQLQQQMQQMRIQGQQQQGFGTLQANGSLNPQSQAGIPYQQHNYQGYI